MLLWHVSDTLGLGGIVYLALCISRVFQTRTDYYTMHPPGPLRIII